MEFNIQNDIITVHSNEIAAYAIKKPINPTVALPDGGFVKVAPFPVTGLSYKEYESYNFVLKRNDLLLRVCAVPYRTVYTDKATTVELSAVTKHLPSRFVPSYNHVLLAEAALSAYVLCMSQQLPFVKVRLTFTRRDSSDSVSFEREYDINSLNFMAEALLDRMFPFIKVFREKKLILPAQIKKLSFPYKDIRSGQHELMLGVMKTLRSGGKLVASAPTGTGKTMATLYPAIKALGAGIVDRVFYLTGKGVTGKAAYDAMNILGEKASELRCITIRAKMSVCENAGDADDCFVCSKVNDIIDEGRFVSYKQRCCNALADLLSEHRMYDSQLISKYAEKYSLCPYELTLDLSEYCDVIICDYNYVFDSAVRFRRYFEEDRGEKYVFLIDEAHNLPDRVRSMYTAEFSPCQLEAITTKLSDKMISDPEMGQAINRCREVFEEIKNLCRENISFYSDKKGDHESGYYKSSVPPSSFVSGASSLKALCRSPERRRGELKDYFDELYSLTSSLITSANFSDQGFAFLAELHDEKLICKNYCLDPSHIISEMSKQAHAIVMFSATLDPVDYFADMLGCSDAPVIKAESPFDPANMSVTIFDGISTRFSDRSDTASDIAEVIANVLEAKEGHYFVFFPSYKYMRTVCRELLGMCPHIKAVMQKPDMTFKDREKFISAFKSSKLKSIVGFCVLGGVFSEGVDLAGDSLIGTVIVGAGLPGISSELNLMSEYYENKYGLGHLYAYDYPAINRIEQAAGRVIRTVDDKGVVVLIDDRLSSPEIASRFPDFWPQISCTSDSQTLALILDRFWENKD